MAPLPPLPAVLAPQAISASGSPSRALPPSSPLLPHSPSSSWAGSRDMELVSFGATLAGDLDTFDRSAYVATMALLLGVPRSSISIEVEPASVRVVCTIETPSAAVALTVLGQLERLSAEELQEALGVAVLEIGPPSRQIVQAEPTPGTEQRVDDHAIRPAPPMQVEAPPRAGPSSTAPELTLAVILLGIGLTLSVIILVRERLRRKALAALMPSMVVNAVPWPSPDPPAMGLEIMPLPSYVVTDGALPSSLAHAPPQRLSQHVIHHDLQLPPLTPLVTSLHEPRTSTRSPPPVLKPNSEYAAAAASSSGLSHEGFEAGSQPEKASSRSSASSLSSSSIHI